jgi:hypothetical protein
MNSQAKAARKNAISLEVKKDGLIQRQSGDWTLRVVFAAADYNDRLGRAPMGTRYACVLVEINDDETPVDHVGIERSRWRDLGAAKQAGMRCKEPVFWAFITEELSFPCFSEEGAAQRVRAICGVESRSDLNKPGSNEARRKWHDLDNAFQAWKAKENA